MIDLQQKTEERSRNNQADKSRKLYAVLGININEFMNISQVKFCDLIIWSYLKMNRPFLFLFTRNNQNRVSKAWTYYKFRANDNLVCIKNFEKNANLKLKLNKVKWFYPNWIAKSLWSFERFDIW